MKFLLVFVIVVLCMGLHTEAYVGVGYFIEDPAHPGQCLSAVYPDTIETYHDIGSTWKSGPCEQSTCGRKDSLTLQIDLEGCGSIEIPPECIPVPMDSSKPFPECCLSAICPKLKA